MAQEIINTGATPTSGGGVDFGSSLRTALTQVNSNFTELYEGAGGTSLIAPVSVPTAAARKLAATYVDLSVTPYIGMQVIQANLTNVAWQLTTLDVTLDASWIGIPLTDTAGDIVANIEIADATGIVVEDNVLGRITKTASGTGITKTQSLRIGDGVTTAGGAFGYPNVPYTSFGINVTNDAELVSVLSFLKDVPYINAASNGLVSQFLNLASGTYTTDIVWENLPAYNDITLYGSTASASMTSVASSSGSVGNRSYVLNVDSSTNARVGGFVSMTFLAGGTNGEMLNGLFKITAKATGQITISSFIEIDVVASGAIASQLIYYNTVIQGNMIFRQRSVFSCADIVFEGGNTAASNIDVTVNCKYSVGFYGTTIFRPSYGIGGFRLFAGSIYCGTAVTNVGNPVTNPFGDGCYTYIVSIIASGHFFVIESSAEFNCNDFYCIADNAGTQQTLIVAGATFNAVSSIAISRNTLGGVLVLPGGKVYTPADLVTGNGTNWDPTTKNAIDNTTQPGAFVIRP